MTATMYELGTMKAALLALVAEQDGEITPEQEAAWDAVEASFDYKVERTVLLIHDREGDVAKLDAEIKRLTAMRDVAKNDVLRIQTFLDGRMRAFGKDSVKTPLAKAWYQLNNPKVDELVPMDTDQFRALFDLVPELVSHTPETFKWNKEAIKAAHKEGMLPPEVARLIAITRTSSLRIK